MLGVGVALIAKGRILGSAPGRAGRAVGVASWLCVALGLFAYAFAVVPVKVSERGSLRIALDAGGYLTPHVAALRMLWLNPGVGVGPARFVGEFQHFTSEDERNRLATANRSRRDPHSAILGLAAEQGLLGLAAFTWLMAQVFKRVARIQDPEMRAAAMAGIAGLLMGGHFVDWLALKGLWLWIGLMVASESSTQGNLRGTFF
jgi:O-antigen ligase